MEYTNIRHNDVKQTSGKEFMFMLIMRHGEESIIVSITQVCRCVGVKRPSGKYEAAGDYRQVRRNQGTD